MESDVPWNSRLGASPAEMVAEMFPPESDTAALTADAGLSLVANPTCMAVIAPADEPPIAIRVASMPYVAAFVRKKRTAVWASCCASRIAWRQLVAAPVQAGLSRR